MLLQTFPITHKWLEMEKNGAFITEGKIKYLSKDSAVHSRKVD